MPCKPGPPEWGREPTPASPGSSDLWRQGSNREPRARPTAWKLRAESNVWEASYSMRWYEGRAADRKENRPHRTEDQMDRSTHRFGSRHHTTGVFRPSHPRPPDGRHRPALHPFLTGREQKAAGDFLGARPERKRIGPGACVRRRVVLHGSIGK